MLAGRGDVIGEEKLAGVVETQALNRRGVASCHEDDGEQGLSARHCRDGGLLNQERGGNVIVLFRPWCNLVSSKLILSANEE